MSKINLVFVVFAVLAFVCITAGKNCETLNGTWYNQRGDELYLERKSDGRLVGEYRTEEQRQNRSAVAHSAALGEYVRFFFDFPLFPYEYTTLKIKKNCFS